MRLIQTTTLLNRIVLAAGFVLVFAVAAGCGDGDRGQTALGGSPEPVIAGAEGTGPRESGWSAARWFDGELGPTDSQVRLKFYARDASGGETCEERLRPELTLEQDRVVLILKSYVADNPKWAEAAGAGTASCQKTEQWLTVDLGEPLGDRPLTQIAEDTEMRVDDGELRIVPQSRPCGRADCSTPSPDPAGCDGDARRQAVEQIDDGSFGSGEPRCDGSFLILGADVGASGCLSDEAGVNPCSRSKQAFFVAREGRWSLVTYGTFDNCQTVLWSSGIRFPAELCV